MKKLVLILILLVTGVMQSQDVNGFYLSRYSPIIDLGTMSVWPEVGRTDFYGNPRLQGRSIDIGAAEFQDRWDRIVTSEITSNSTILIGDSIEIMASGGESYTWDSGETTRTITVSPTVTTTYTVTVNEYGTIDTTQITVTVVDPNLEQVANIGDDFTICNNTPIILRANGSSFATYTWSTGETTKEITVSLTSSTLISVTIVEPSVTSTDFTMIYVDPNCN